MRILLNVKFPHQPFNAAVKNGTAGSKLSLILEAIKPEAVYFTEQNGQRGAMLIVDLPDPSKIPALAEPWFLTFEADVEAMLNRGSRAIGPSSRTSFVVALTLNAISRRFQNSATLWCIAGRCRNTAGERVN